MKTLLVLFTAFILAVPNVEARDRYVYRDRDGDGHYNKKKIDDDDRRHSRYRGGRGYYGGYYGRPYYGGSRYYGRPYYDRHYYGRPYYYSRPSVRVYSRPTVVRSVTRSYSNDSLEASVQSVLRRKGYYRGAIDGDIGPGSRSAIRAYQDDHGLSVNGRIDSALLRSLGL